jgi:hypothetical protein
MPPAEYAEARSGAIPPRALNGGLYTGAPFEAGAPWANAPIVPDSNVYIRSGLTIGNVPPPGARTQTIGDRGGSTPHGSRGDVKYVQVLNMSFPDSCPFTPRERA